MWGCADVLISAIDATPLSTSSTFERPQYLETSERGKGRRRGAQEAAIATCVDFKFVEHQATATCEIQDSMSDIILFFEY
jgi:hypothetical protein